MESFFIDTYSKYKHQVYFFVKKYIEGGEDIEDVVQDVFVHLWNHRKSLGSQTEAMVYKTAKQEVANFYRRNKMVFDEFKEEIPIEGESASDSREEQTAVDYEKVQGLLQLMPEKSREYFLQHKLEGLSYSQIAKENHISKNAVSKHVNKVIKHLKTSFGLSSLF